MSTRTSLKLVASLAVSLAAPRAASAAEAYAIDPVHTSIVFSASHVGLSYTYGFFREAAGNYILDEANPANCRFQLVIQTNSLDTNHAKRDEHLSDPDFFDVRQFPTITFQSTSCTRADTRDQSIVYQVTGNLTIHGETRQVTVPLRMLAKGKGAHGDQRTGFLCQLELKRSEFGMKNLIQNNMVGDAIGITISFEGMLQDQAGATPRQR